MTRVFIDGQAGTTGLQIAERLGRRDDLCLLTIDERARKSPEARARLFEQADIAILCLPDAAAREAVSLAGSNCRIIDASSAYRVDPGWAYGLPELTPEARAAIAGAQWVSNPGCYPQGFILMIRPLIDAGMLSADTPLRVNAVSGYSGGGRNLIERYQGFDDGTAERLAVQDYALDQGHKHLPEMHHYSGTRDAPLFTPMVANYRQGMLVHVPLFASELGGAGPEEVRAVLAERYHGEPFVDVLPTGAADAQTSGYLNATACNDSNRIELMVFGDATRVLLLARYDNLGKGASGAAVQNLNLMIGVEETTGLIGQ